MSPRATRTSIRVVPSRSISRTSTASASSTRALTIISTVSRMIQKWFVLDGTFAALVRADKSALQTLCGLGLSRRNTLGLRGLLDQLAHTVGRLLALFDPVTDAFG